MNMSTKNQYNKTNEAPTINTNELAYVFVDMDGTLLDTLPGLYKVYMTFLKDHHEKGNQKEFDSLNGRTVSEVVQILKNRYHLKSLESHLEKYYKDLYLEYYQKLPPLYPHALETLQYLKSRGLKLVLVTSASSELAGKVLANPLLKDLFYGSVTGDMVKKGKPDPEIFEMALAKFNIKPNQAVVLEDAPHGIEAALNANIYVVRHFPKLSMNNRFHPGWVEVKNWEMMHLLFQFLYE
jgi:HAD superfamily hydrolase (TIGR01509 family)